MLNNHNLAVLAISLCATLLTVAGAGKARASWICRATYMNAAEIPSSSTMGDLRVFSIANQTLKEKEYDTPETLDWPLFSDTPDAVVAIGKPDINPIDGMINFVIIGINKRNNTFGKKVLSANGGGTSEIWGQCVPDSRSGSSQ